ncbi:MAG: hypothetical protein ABEJ65_00825 [bacterium]
MNKDKAREVYHLLDSEKFQQGIEVVLNQKDPLITFQAVLNKFFKMGNTGKINELEQIVPDDHPIIIPPKLVMTKIATDNDKLDTCNENLQFIARKFKQFRDRLENYPFFQENYDYLLQQALYFHPSLQLTEDNSLPFEVKKEDLPRSDSSGDVVVASANGTYFDIFGEDFLQSCELADDLDGVHLHLIKPTEDSLELVQSQQDALSCDLTWTIERDPYYTGLAYVACSRFMVAQKIMEETGSDIIISDLDSEFSRKEALNVDEFLPPDGNIGLFERTHVTPQLVCPCALIYWRNNERTLRFLRLLNSYYVDRLNLTDEYWCLDQTALYVLSRRVLKGELEHAGLTSENFRWSVLGGPEQRLNNQSNIENMELDKKYELRQEYQSDYGFVKHDPCEFEFEDGRLTIPGDDTISR